MGRKDVLIRCVARVCYRGELGKVPRISTSHCSDFFVGGTAAGGGSRRSPTPTCGKRKSRGGRGGGGGGGGGGGTVFEIDDSVGADCGCEAGGVDGHQTDSAQFVLWDIYGWVVHCGLVVVVVVVVLLLLVVVGVVLVLVDEDEID